MAVRALACLNSKDFVKKARGKAIESLEAQLLESDPEAAPLYFYGPGAA